MIRAGLRHLADFALPPRCPGCGVPVEVDHRFCTDCWRGLRFLAPPWCATCHTPFIFHRGEEAQCAVCLASPPRHAGIDAAVGYGPVARVLALKLKYGGRMGVAKTVARSMRRHLPADAEWLVPVPLHRWRLWARGYNQAGLIAAALASSSGVPCMQDALVRTRRTSVLRGMGGRERRRAVAGAFALHPSRRAAIGGRRVVLIDDVYTTGATADACVRTLLAGGAARVSILCWARVLDEADD